MRAKVTLGFPSRTAAVVALRAEGMITDAIAARIGIEPKTVIALERSGERCRRVVAAGAKTILFPPEILHRLALHAERRGVSAAALCRQIVETVLDDKIVDAVLDDGAPA